MKFISKTSMKFMHPFVAILLRASCFLVLLLNNSLSEKQQVIDLEWKFNSILILPAGCEWSRHVTWRIAMRCPNPRGQFFVATRLQASANHTYFCSGAGRTLFTSSADLSVQSQNQNSYLKQARQQSSLLFGDGLLNRYDFPYFPVYNSSQATYWQCVGANVSECHFYINASHYANQPASHGKKLQLATLILPGPYCSSVDSFELWERTGGTVWRLPESSRSSVIKKLEFFDEPKETLDYFDVNALGPDATDLNAELARKPDMRRSENVYLVASDQTSPKVISSDVTNFCVARLSPRDPQKARAMWYRSKYDFRRAILANIHINFIQVTYNGYSTFYDDMTALQHDNIYWRSLFRVLNISNDGSTVHLGINFHNIQRRLDKRPVRIGLAMYEFLVVGDETAQMLGSHWPYRYMSPSRQLRSKMLLLRSATLLSCSTRNRTYHYNGLPLLGDNSPVKESKLVESRHTSLFRPSPSSSEEELDPTRSRYDPVPVLRPPEDSGGEVEYGPDSDWDDGDDIDPNACHNLPWCPWLWVVVVCLVVFVFIATLGILMFFHFNRPYRPRYFLRRRILFGSTDSPTMLIASALTSPPNSVPISNAPSDNGSYVQVQR